MVSPNGRPRPAKCVQAFFWLATGILIPLIVSGKALKRFWNGQNMVQRNLQETAFTTACLPCETLSTALFLHI